MAWKPANEAGYIAAYMAGATDDELARLHATTFDKARHFTRKLVSTGAVPKRGEFTPVEIPESAKTVSQLEMNLLALLKKSKTAIPVSNLANSLDCSPKRVEEMIAKLGANNYLVEQAGEHVQFAEPMIGERSVRQTEYLDDSRVFTFAVATDAHICSKYHRADALNTFYDICEQEGITTVFDCGNQIDGEARFNKQDLLVHGMGNQFNYWAKHYPKREGITTYFVSGDDHEGWYQQREGINVGKHMEFTARDLGRDDLVFLGYMEHDVEFQTPEGGKTIVRVQHPGGGSAYALSYTPQKIVESRTGGEKPHICLLGHYHKHGYFFIRNVHTLLCGCFQDQTPFMRKKRLAAHVGGVICKVHQAPDGSVLRFTHTFVPFYDNRETKENWAYKFDG